MKKLFALLVVCLSASCRTLNPVPGTPQSNVSEVGLSSPSDKKVFEKYTLEPFDVGRDSHFLEKAHIFYYSAGKLLVPILTIYGDKFIPEGVAAPHPKEVHFIREFYHYGASVPVNFNKFYDGCLRSYDSQTDYNNSLLTSKKFALRLLDPSEVKKLNLPYLNQNICKLATIEVSDGADTLYCEVPESKVYQSQINGMTLFFVSEPGKLRIYEPLANKNGYAEVLNFDETVLLKDYGKDENLKVAKGERLKFCEAFYGQKK